ncbi:glycosyltransferase family 2 protein [Mordavella massiliensis]|uniref:Glycosyltransferase family 2 protein n=1 Tax=Mordavella massiliensis TaxID=1871024 RepID=A0A939BH65_9CLOT|nr:glycosyltransferase family 2 protein [Mordavella massiliensis]MBM6948820.1 glycosyltransferase family 2 protein [Mordavella massiliensis]
MAVVSVIMPVYNSENYVEDAVNSILRQSEKNIQVILVDDGSQDRSGIICDKIAERDERVVVIHQKNQGICAARNSALKVANGDYITFCDNDDEFLPNLIADNYKIAKEYNADIVRFCRRRIVSVDGKVIRDSVMNNFPFLVIKNTDYAKYDHEISSTGNGVWTGLYKTSFIKENRLHFDESMRYGHEDNMFNLQAYQVFKVMVLNPKVYYIWKNRMEHSTTGKFNLNYIESLKKCLEEDVKLAKQYATFENNMGSYQSKLARAYVYPLYDYLNLAKKRIRLSEKRNIVKEFRNHIGFQVPNNCRMIKRDGILIWGMWNFFYHRLYMVPYVALHIKQKIFNS